MTQRLRAVPSFDEFPTVEIPVIDGELDETTEIPLIGLRPAVPPTHQAPRPRPRRFLRYGWLVGLLIAGLFFYVPLLLQGLADAAGWVLVVGVIWTVIAVPLAFLVGLGVRLADQRDGIR